MKKLFTIIALVLTVALCASFAAGAVKVSGNGNSTSTDVSISYEATSQDTTTVIYSVEIEWTDIEFVYNAGQTQWNPETHNYDATKIAGSWTNDKGSVKVTNHSNAAIIANVAFATAANGEATMTVTTPDIEVDSAVGSEFNAAPSGTTELTVSGTPNAQGSIGTLTVTINGVN